MTGSASTIAIRTAARDDRAEILDLLAASLRWIPDDLFERFFVWKHDENPFGASPSWVATDGGRIVGFRTFLRWEFESVDGATKRAVRAVDTATHPDAQGRGVFRQLTEHALDELRAAGVDFVFNTPNSNSRPGYLKMGWHDVGRLPTSIRPRSPAALVRILRSRVPADKWSQPSAGVPAADVLGDPRVDALVQALAPAQRLRTRRTVAFLRWRYGFAPLHYRAVVRDDDPARGLAIFRVRRRGAATEAACCDVLVPRGDPAAARDLLGAVRRAANADYLLRIGGPVVDRSGFVRLPGQGPVLTWRGVTAANDAATTPDLGAWDFQLGDIELF